MAETSELLRRVWNSQSYTDFAIRNQGIDFAIPYESVLFLKKLELLLYQENHLNADNQRDLAQKLTHLLDTLEAYDY